MKQQKDWVDFLQRARWDRLLGTLIALIVVIILITAMCKSCGRNQKSVPAGTTETVADTQPTTETPVDHSMDVYLSPSTQYDNVYACDGVTTEADAMIALAGKVQEQLEARGYTVYICGETDSVKEKVAQGNELQCGAYVALHTNSGGDSGSGEGTECYYNSAVPGSYALAENIYNRVAALTPTEDRGIKDETQRDLYEIANNTSACCLLEVEFHDVASLSQWVMDNMDNLAEEIADGIEAYLKNTAASSSGTSSEATTEEMTETETVQ